MALLDYEMNVTHTHTHTHGAHRHPYTHMTARIASHALEVHTAAYVDEKAMQN